MDYQSIVNSDSFMQVEFQLCENDYKHFFRSHLINEIIRNAYRTILLGFLLVFITTGHNANPWWLNSIIAFAVAIGINILLYCGILIFYQFRIKRFIKIHPQLFEKKITRITDIGLESTYQESSSIWLWESIEKIRLTKDYIGVFLRDNKIGLIPKRCFASENDATNFIGSLHLRMNHRYGINQPSSVQTRSRATPPYLLALLCFIPFIGIVIGIWLTIIGLNKFKNKLLISLGIIGILVSAYFSYIIRDSYINGKNKMEQMQMDFKSDYATMCLNSLMKEIEFFKLQYGAYPDSLQQISTNDAKSSIYDSFANSSDSLYYYKKESNNYYLLSVGPDGKPKTSDDIHPDIVLSDSSRCGILNIKK